MYDVIVVGGGPAGSAAAITCAQKNLRVLLLEKMTFPRDHPGETLHPGVESILQQLGVRESFLQANFIRHNGIFVTTGSDRQFQPYGADASGEWLGFQAWRADFDAKLLEQAGNFGVQIIQPCRVIRPILADSRACASGNRVVGVETNQGEYRSKFIIDATGSNGWLAKQLQLQVNYLSPRLIANYGYVTGANTMNYDNPQLAVDEDGWIWTAQVRPQVYQWTRLSFTQQKTPKDWTPGDFQNLTPLQSTRRADVTWRKVNGTAGPGYFIVGDAAHVLDPAASHGVLKALMTGIMAGHLISQSVAKENLEEKHIVGYQKWLDDWLAHDVSKLHDYYSKLPCSLSWLKMSSAEC
jgi:flavin-dependent dehydrogenase